MFLDCELLNDKISVFLSLAIAQRFFQAGQGGMLTRYQGRTWYALYLSTLNSIEAHIVRVYFEIQLIHMPVPHSITLLEHEK